MILNLKLNLVLGLGLALCSSSIQLVSTYSTGGERNLSLLLQKSGYPYPPPRYLTTQNELNFDPEDGSLLVPDIVAKYGYPIETHEITTEDGYVLTAHRIPYGKQSGPGPNKPVVWLQHGILGDSSNWIWNSESKALAYKLANAGYDVWMGNARGNRYSRKHVSIPVSSPAFWMFSWHEMGVYDIPAVIDYVLGLTGQPKMKYIGHSMGTTMFFVCMMERPEYNSKIALMSAFAPVTYTGYITSALRLLAPYTDTLENIFGLIGYNEFLPNRGLLEFFGQLLCRSQGGGYSELCDNIFLLMVGAVGELHQLDPGMIPVIMGHCPAGSSTRALVHYAQGINTKDFRKFDHGRQKNLEVYGTEIPPRYDFNRITCPVALYWGEDDGLASKVDVYTLATYLPNLVKYHRVDNDRWNHMDFLWATDNPSLLLDLVMDFMGEY